MTDTDSGDTRNGLVGHTGLRRRLSITLVGVALVSVLLLATVNYVFARVLIDDSVESQLSAVRDTRVQALEIGAERLQARVSALATNPSVADALTDLAREFDGLDDDITSGDVDQLDGPTPRSCRRSSLPVSNRTRANSFPHRSQGVICSITTSAAIRTGQMTATGSTTPETVPGTALFTANTTHSCGHSWTTPACRTCCSSTSTPEMSCTRP
jgi:hypothetical protein